MNCIVCTTKLPKNKVYAICSICYRDDTKIILATDIKTEYKLSVHDLKAPGLFCMRYNGHRYLRTEIHTLAEKITADLRPNHPKKVAFQTKDKIIKEREQYAKDLITVKTRLLELLSKHNPNNLPTDEELSQVILDNYQPNADITSQTIIDIYNKLF